MFQTLTFLHNLTRWLVLAGVLAAIVTAAVGLIRTTPYTRAANALRHWAATIGHLQLVIGMLLYARSPAISYYWHHPAERSSYPELRFFALIHPACMLLAIVLLTIGSGLAKRREGSRSKYRTVLIWHGVALLIMLAAIPWPFSPLASRPYWR